jgi:hypothetical protein
LAQGTGTIAPSARFYGLDQACAVARAFAGGNTARVGTILDANLDAKSMLEERVIEWTRAWKEEGMREGQIALLQTQLEARFGPLPDWALARLKESTAAEIERWCLRILNQPSLQDVLN